MSLDGSGMPAAPNCPTPKNPIPYEWWCLRHNTQAAQYTGSLNGLETIPKTIGFFPGSESSIVINEKDLVLQDTKIIR